MGYRLHAGLGSNVRLDFVILEHLHISGSFSEQKQLFVIVIARTEI